MALHNLKITVVDGGKMDDSIMGADSNSGEEQEDDSFAKFRKVLNYNDTIKKKLKQSMSKTQYFALQSTVSLATQTAKQFANYLISDIGRANGDSNYQAIVNRRIEQVTDVLSFGQGMVSGAAAGAMAGPVGAAIGAAVGAIGAGVNLGFKYAERERSYQHQMFEEQNSQAYQLARANYSAMTGRIR